MEEYPYPYPVAFLPLQIEGKACRMAYMDVAPTGKPNGKTILLLHGKNFWGAYWQETISLLAAYGYRVVVPDQIGFGKSSKPDDIPYSFDLLAQNTRDLLDALKVGKVAVVGHSMGGMLAVRLARNYPERVTQLVLEDPIGLEDYRLKVPAVPLDQLVQDEMDQTEEAIRAYRKSYFVHWLPAYERFVEAPARMRLSGEYPRAARVAALTTAMILQQPVRQEFSLITQPTLLVIGRQDRTAVGKQYAPKDVAATLGDYPALGRAAVKDIPHATLVEIPDCAHIPHIEAERAFHAALLDFLARTP
jgi:pimeloyl-ACP methyl ester carboxylesterase